MADLQYTVQVETSQVNRNLDNLNTKVDKLTNKFSGLQSAISSLAIGAAISNAIRYADAIQDLSDATGIATSSIVGFSTAVSENGGNADTANNSLLKFVQTIGDAVEGSNQAQRAFKDVGVSLTDIQTLSEQDLLAKTVAGIGKMDDATKRISAQVALFGKNARGVNFQGVAGGFGGAIQQSGQYASAIKSAADAQQSLENNLRNFTTALLKVLQPLTDLVASVKISVGAFETLMKIIGTVGLIGIFGALGKAIYSVASGLNTFIFNTLRAMQNGLGKTVKETSVFKNAVSQIKDAFVLADSPITKFLAVLGLVAGALLKFGSLIFRFLSGPWGLLLTSIVMFKDEILSFIPALKPVFDFVAKGFEKIKNAMGFGEDKPKLFEQADVRKIDNLTVAIDDTNEKTKAFQERLQKVKQEINKIGDEYAYNNNKQLQSITNEMQLIGLSEQQIEKQRALTEALNKQDEVLKQLAEKKKEYSQGTEEQKASIGLIDAEIARVKQLGAEYTKDLSARIDGYQKLMNIENLRQFQLQQQIGLENQLADIQDQIAMVTLPEMEKRYYAIEAAARAAARAAIQVEEARRGTKLSPDEAKAYYDAASKGSEELKNKQTELLGVQEKMNVRQFQIQNENRVTQQMIDLNDQLATLTMPALEKKYYDIEKAAKASALAEIQSAEARLGRKLSTQEAQQYYDAASKGTDELKQKTQELYESSRTFETGWKQAFNTYVEDATNAATRASDIFNAMTSNMNSALDKFVDTGKFSFKDLANSIIKDILKIELKAAAANLFKALGSGFGGGGGLFGGAIIPGFLADGGPASAGKPYIVGEEGPELFVPKGSGTVIPNNMMGSSSEQPIVYNITNNVSAVDAQSVARLFANNRQLMLGTIEQARKELPIRQGRR